MKNNPRSKDASPAEKGKVNSQTFLTTDLLGWLTNGISDGMTVIFQDEMILENDRFRHLIETVTNRAETSRTNVNVSSSPLPTRERILSDAAAWNDQPLGTRWTRRYQGIDLAGRECFYEGTFTLVPLRQRQAVLVVLQDLTDHMRLASEVDISSRFRTVFARIGELAVSEVPVQSIMNEAVQLTAEALRVELCKILIPRDSHEFLYLVAGFGWRPGLIGSLTVEGGTQSQAGFAIRERQPVLVRDLRIETRFTPSKLLSDHHVIAGMSVPMMVQDRVYGVMGAHCKTVRDFTEQEQEFLLSVGNVIATVLERWRREETQLQLFHRMFELAQDGIMLTDTKGRLIEWNPALEHMTGWKAEEVIGQTPSVLKSNKHPPEFYDRIWSTLSAGQAFVSRFVNRRKDGSELVVWESISPVKDPDGTVRFYLAILTDLTERERMLGILRHAEQIKLVGQLAGGILHEIRNPLIGIGSLATYLRDQSTLDEIVRNRCRLIAQEANRIDDILETYLGQIPPRTFDFRPCDLMALLDDTLTLLSPKLKSSTIDVSTELAKKLPMVQASQGHLQQVWLNVVINAIEAMEHGGTLTITMHPATIGKDGVSIAFQDSGPGISPGDLQRMSEPFFTSGKAKGVGLGLTISRDIIERHGGQFSISSPAGQGAVVTIWLPLLQQI
ncbi:MAG: PAS domain S-box protein [Nitrospirales bacterium]|nr:PAS domain S-box protein [Nitrospirales bacterium]MBA3964222.1 PAS domain S-box protein [Nitrospirales bacterium]